MLANRLISVGGIVLAAALLSLGSNVEYGAEAYMFPNVLAWCLIVFAVTLLIFDGNLMSWLKETASFLWRWMFGVVGEGNPSRWPDTVRLIPMFIVLIGYLYFADIVGLYATSFIAFFLIVMIYTTKRPRGRDLLKNLLISGAFTGVIYLIFAVLLQLQTPQAWLM